MTNERKETMEIDLRKLVGAYLRRWWLFAICIFLSVAASFYVTKTMMTPMYRAGVTIYVNNVRAGQQVNYITSANLQTAQRLVSTYIEIIQSDTVLEKVAQEAGGGFTPQGIRSAMSAKQKGETELFDLYITHRDPAQAAMLANAVAKVAPSEIERFVEGSSATIVDYAKVPTAPYSPSVVRNAILGGLMGLLLAAAYVTLRFMMDVRIREENDLAEMFSIPVLGQIPAFAEGSRKKRKNSGCGYESDANAGEKGENEK